MGRQTSVNKITNTIHEIYAFISSSASCEATAMGSLVEKFGSFGGVINRHKISCYLLFFWLQSPNAFSSDMMIKHCLVVHIVLYYNALRMIKRKVSQKHK